METTPRIIRTYLVLQFGNTLAASLIWGINTLFLLNAGLSIFEAFLANAFFTLGMVIFEIPTGIVADSWGRRVSYLLGTVTLSASTILYYFLWQAHSPFILWVLASMLLGLGFTFFSGAVEAWLIDALHFVKYKGKVEAVFGKAQVVSGIAMLLGTLGGGIIAQFTTLGVPYLVRGGILIVLFVVAWMTLKDIGFVPEHSERAIKAMRTLLVASIDNGLKVAPVRWLMLSAIIISSVGFYAFYALQPYLLQIYGDMTAYWIAGLAATFIALAQITGGLLASRIASWFAKRTTALAWMTSISTLLLVLLFVCNNFIVALGLIFMWGLLFAAVMPIRQSYMNGMIPSKQRATVLSFDSVMSNLGGMVIQPGLAKVADMASYGASFLVGGLFQLLAIPMLLRSRHFAHEADNTHAPKV
jgi:MFS family permease